MDEKRGPRTVPFLLVALLAGCAIPISNPNPAPAPQQTTPAPAPAAPVQEPPAAGSNEPHSPTPALQVPIDKTKLAGAKSAELWITMDGGKNWTNHGEIDPKNDTAPYLAPRDGRYGFRVVAVAADGKREATPKPGDAPDKTLVVDTTMPVVELLSPNGGEMFGAGRSTIVRWIAVDANLEPGGIRIEATDGDNVWSLIAKDLPNTGQYHWDIRPFAGGKVKLRVVARDLAGNAGMDASDKDFLVDGLPPDLKITGPLGANQVPVRLDWTGGDPGGSGLKRVSFWVTRDGGQTWKHHGDDDDLQTPYLFTDLDGALGLRIVAEDRMGNATPAPIPGSPPQATLVLDRTPPAVKLLSPRGGGYHAGVAVDVRWEASDNLDMPANPISLHYSEDAGKSWKEIATGLKNDGMYAWTPSRKAGEDYRFRVTAVDTAGNARMALSERFGIDEAIPEARVVSPDGSNSHSVQVHYEIQRKGSAPIRKVTLYYRPDGMKEWIKYGDDPDAVSPMLFAKADGKYGLYVVCATESGMKSEFAQKAPEEGVEPQKTIRIDATPPQVTLETFGGGGYAMAGTVAEIHWKLLEVNPDPRGMNVYHTPDGGGNWNVVAVNADPTTGVYRWTVPTGFGGRHKIRIVAVDAFGNKGVAESERPFTIDADLPTVAVLEAPPAVVRGDRLSLKYKAADVTSGIDRVLLYGRPAAETGDFKLLSETRAPEGTIESAIPAQGRWSFLLIAVDAAGHQSRELAKDAKPDFVAGFDRTKPELALKRIELEKGKPKTYVNASWEIEWTARDNFSPADRLAIRVEASEDNGKTWTVKVPRIQNVGKADMRPHFRSGKRYKVRVLATDEAGNEAEDTSDDFDPGEVPPPPLALRGIDDGRRYVLGTAVTVLWATPDRSIREADLELSRDGGRTWTTLQTLHTASVRLPLPEKEGRYMIRAAARDAANRPFWSNAAGFEMISGVEQVRLVANAQVEAGRLLRVHVEPKSIFGIAREIKLEIFDGKEWTKVDDVKKQDMTIGAPATPGEYALRVSVVAADGKEYSSNEPRVLVTPRDSASELQLMNFRGDKVYAGGTRHPIVLKTEIDLADLVLELSESGGAEGTWRPIPKEHLEIASGRHFWKLPTVTGTRMRLRVSHKDPERRISAMSEKDFAIDSQRPSGQVLAPTVDVASPVRLEVRADKTISPLKRMHLWTSRNGGKTWGLHKTYPAAAALSFEAAESGDYGLYLVLENEEGIAGERPNPGTMPQSTVKIRGGAAPAVAPTVEWPKEFVTPLPAKVRGGTVYDSLRWAVSDASAKVSLWAVVDGKEEPLAKDQPATGSAKWTAPMVDSKSCKLVLQIGPRRLESPLFEIDSRPPKVDAVEIEVPKR